MQEKTIQMIIYYVLALCDDDKKTIKSCIETNKLLIAIVKNEETKADKLIYNFPDKHPVRQIYDEIRNSNNLLDLLENSKIKFEKSNLDDDCLKIIDDDSQVIGLSNKINAF